MNRTVTLGVFLLAAMISDAPGKGLSPDPLRYVSPSRPFHTIHTSLDLGIDLEKQAISGSVTHRMQSLREGLDEVQLNCVGLVVDAVLVNGSSVSYEYPVPGDRTSSWFGTQDPTEADDRLVIALPAGVDRGGEFELTVRYHGSPDQGLYWIQPEKGLPNKRLEVWSQGEGEDNRYWIPCHDYPDDKSTFEGRFRVDKGVYALSNGRLVSQTDMGATTEFYWKLDQPQASYLIMLAAARYDVHQENVDGVDLLVVVPPGTPKETVERGYGGTGDMVQFFSRTIGIDYPFEKYAQVVVQDFIYGGMENTTATVMNARTLHDAGEELTRSEQGLVAHELAHQWWGDMLTSREWSHLWLNEGFATYYQGLYREHLEGDDAFRYEMHTRHERVVERDKQDARPVVTDFYNRRDARNNANIYIKGASVLHMLRHYLGDALYHEVIRHYGEAHKHGTVETNDLARAVKDVTGENLDWFFEQWIYLAGHPRFDVSKRWDQDTGILRLSVKQTQETGDLVPVFRVPLDIEITTTEGAELHRVLIEREEHEFSFRLSAKPEMVIFDKGDWILKELSFPKPTDELLRTLETADYMSRVRAAKALASKGSDARTVGALRTVLLADGHYGLRRTAALSLGEIRSGDARATLIDGLSSADARVRMACAEALGPFKRDNRAGGGLHAVRRSDPAWGVRAAAVTSLVKMRAQDATKVCYEALGESGGSGIVRRAGLDGLVELRETDALPKIQPLCRPGNDRASHRHAAIAAYAKLASYLDDEHDRERAADFLADMLDDGFLRTRRTVITALQTLGDPSAVATLREQASRDPIESLRIRARQAADRIVAKRSDAASTEEIEHRVKELEDRLGTLEEDLGKARAGSD